MAFFKMFSIIFGVILVMLQVVNAERVVEPHEEYRVIVQFCNYFNTISRIKLDNMLDMTKIFVLQVLDTIPFQERGNSAEMLQKFVDDAELVSQGRSNDDRRAVLMELQTLIESIQSEMVKQEPEDLIIREGLGGMFELLARLSIEERKFGERFVRSADVLRRKFSPAGRQRHAQFFDVLDAYEAEDDIVRREELLRQFRAIKKEYLS